MSYTNSGDRAYGIQNPLQSLSPKPISAQRAPTTADQSPVNTLWCDLVTQTSYICAGTVNAETTWNQIESGGGAGDFASITVTTGANVINGTTAINNNYNANTEINSGTSTGSVTIGGASAGSIFLETNGATANAVDITCANATGGMTFDTGSGGFNILSDGILEAQDLAPMSVASPTATVACAANLGTVTFTGFTTAAYAAGTITTQVFTITNASITTTSGVLVTVNDLGTNDAQMAITRVKLAAGSMAVTVGNFGSAALNGNLEISFWIYRY